MTIPVDIKILDFLLNLTIRSKNVLAKNVKKLSKTVVCLNMVYFRLCNKRLYYSYENEFHALFSYKFHKIVLLLLYDSIIKK